MKALITGGTGFLGANLAQGLVGARLGRYAFCAEPLRRWMR